MCEPSKHYRAKFLIHAYALSSPFSIIHNDVWGPSRVFGGRWFITFIDDHTRVCWIYLLKKKLGTAIVFQTFHKTAQNQFQTKIKILRTNHGTKYFSEFREISECNGIIYQSSCVETTQQNGAVERKNRYLLVARTLMFQMGVPKQY